MAELAKWPNYPDLPYIFLWNYLSFTLLITQNDSIIKLFFLSSRTLDTNINNIAVPLSDEYFTV